MKTLTLLMAALVSFVMLAGSASAAQWVKDPGSCPQTYSGQNCVPNYVCGLIGSVAQCNTSSIWIPDTYYASNQTQVSVSLATGYVLNCLAPTTCQGQWSCQVNTTCEDASNNWITNCTAVTNSVCAKVCKSGYTDCGAISGGTWNGWPKCNATSVAWCQSPMIYDPCTGICSDIYVRLNASDVPPTQSGNASISGDFYLGRLLKVGSTSFMNSTHVGIGTTAAARPLHVVSTTSGVLRLERTSATFVDFNISGSGNNWDLIIMPTDDPAMNKNTGFIFRPVNGAVYEDVLALTNNFKVGIGTANPQADFEVAVNGGVNISGTEAAGRHTLYADTNNGLVGIGTNSPGNYKLNVMGDVNASWFNATTGVNASQVCLGAVCKTAWPAAGESPWANSSLTTFVRGGYPQSVNISANLTVGSTSFMNSTHVGVGTINPQKNLEVVGTANISSNLTVDTTTLHVDATNNYVGIGTTTPGATLNIADTIQNAARIILSGQEFYQGGQTMTSGVALLLGVNRAGNKQLWIGDSSALTQNTTNVLLRVLPSTSGAGYARIDALATDGTTIKNLSLQGGGGNVGIGTTGPMTPLHLSAGGNNADLRIQDSDSTGIATIAYAEFGGTSGGAWVRTGYVGDGATGNSDIYLSSDSGNVLLQPTSGSVGIGSSAAPAARLQVAPGGEGASDYTARFQNSATVATGGATLFDQGSTYSWAVYTAGTSATTGSLTFHLINAGSGADVYSDPALTMGNARVGIGEGAPQTTLHVFGSLGLRVEEPNYNFMTIACNPGRCALNTSGTGVAGAGNYIEIDPDSLTYGLILRDHLGTVIATSNAKWSNLMTVDGANYGSTTDFMQMGVETTTDGIFITNTSLVGIGAVRPTQKLEVVGNINTSYTLAATTNGVCHSGANAAAALPVGDRRVLVVCSGAPTDIAEWYDTTGTEPGDVVATTDKTITYDSPVVNARTGEILNTSDSLTVSVLERSGRAYQPNLLGVISTSPAQSYGRSIINVSQMPNPLAIAGRVPVKISTANGPIRPGDAITSSMLEGFGMKATEPGTIVGRALDSFDGSSGELCKNDPRYKCGKIVIYISVGYWEPEKHEQNQESEMKQLKQALEKLRVENLELNAKYKRLEALFEK